MNELQERILNDGIVINNDILKVDSFINHQIDTELVLQIAKYLSQNFHNVTKILTIETSGIAFAFAVAQQYGNVPIVFAKKSKSAIVDEKSIFKAQVKSFTRNITSTICVDKRYISEDDNILIIDDFLAEGNASLGLIDICKQANAQILGVGVAIEKRFQGGKQKIEELGYKVISAAAIECFYDNKPIFCK